MLIGGREVAMIFVDLRLRVIMKGIDLAHEGEGAVAAASRCSHIGASAQAHPRAPAWCRLYQTAETPTHPRHRPRRARRLYPIGPPYVFAMDVPVGRRAA